MYAPAESRLAGAAFAPGIADVKATAKPPANRAASSVLRIERHFLPKMLRGVYADIDRLADGVGPGEGSTTFVMEN